MFDARSLTQNVLRGGLAAVALLCVCASVVRADARVELREKAAVHDEYIRLADVARLTGLEAATGDVFLGRSPRPGAARVLTRKQVEIRLRAHGLDGQALVVAGAPRVTVRYVPRERATPRRDGSAEPDDAAETVSAAGRADTFHAYASSSTGRGPRAPDAPSARKPLAEAVQALAERHLGDLLSLPDATVSAEVQSLEAPDPVPAATHGLEIIEAPQAFGRGRMTFVYALRNRAGLRVGTATARIDAEAMLPVVQPRRSIARGALVRAEDLYLASAPLDRAGRACNRIEQVAGKRARRDLRAGQPISTGAVEVLPLVERGQAVTVRARVGRLVVRHRGTALQAGAAGDVVMVRNVRSDKVYPARVLADGRLELAE